MKKYRIILPFCLLSLLSGTACNHSGGQQTFSNFTNDTFAQTADDRPADIENVNLIFDVENDGAVFDELIMNGEFSV